MYPGLRPTSLSSNSLVPLLGVCSGEAGRFNLARFVRARVPPGLPYAAGVSQSWLVAMGMASSRPHGWLVAMGIDPPHPHGFGCRSLLGHRL